MEWKNGEQGVVKHCLKQRGVAHEWCEEMNLMLAEKAHLMRVFCWHLIYCVRTSIRWARSSTFHDKNIFISSSINSLKSFLLQLESTFFAGTHLRFECNFMFIVRAYFVSIFLARLISPFALAVSNLCVFY